MQAITGNTYPVRREMRELGGIWNANQQAWLVPDDRADEARALLPVGSARRNASRPRNSRSYGSRYTRFQGGGEHFVNRRGRCEDAPCCGCCS